MLFIKNSNSSEIVNFCCSILSYIRKIYWNPQITWNILNDFMSCCWYRHWTHFRPVFTMKTENFSLPNIFRRGGGQEMKHWPEMKAETNTFQTINNFSSIFRCIIYENLHSRLINPFSSIAFFVQTAIFERQFFLMWLLGGFSC